MASQLNVRPAHRAHRGARPRWALLRVVIALLLAVLTLPLAAMASADDLPSGGETTEGQVLGTTSEEEILDGQDGALDEQPVGEAALEEPAPQDPAAEEAPAEVAPGERAPAPAGGQKAAPRDPDAASDPLTGAVEAAVEQLVQIAAITVGELDTATYDPADEQGADDEPNQKDLTKLWAWSPTNGSLKIGWNWDETGWTGKNTGDACALFDIDQDTSADYAVCVTVEKTPAVQKTDVSPRVYECTTDGTNSATNCLGAVLRTGTSTTCEVTQTSTNPFVTGGSDTTALCTIDLDDVGGSGTTVLTNVCTYPSEQPTSDDSDCVLAPRDAKLTVKKIASPADTGQLFTFNLTTKGVTQQFAQLPAGGSFSAGVSSADDANLVLAEVVPDGWTLESATCDNGQLPNALDLESEDEVTCTFTNSRDASVKVVKNWVINGTQYADGRQSNVFAAQLTLSGVNNPTFGSTYSGFSQGDTVTIGEAEPITMPKECENKASGDLGPKTLSGGLNEFTITNTVTCAASVKVDKSWVINGVAFEDGKQPADYAAQLTLTGNEGADAFGDVYSGYTEGDTVTIGEVDPITMPEGCTNTPTGDIGTETLQRGLNEFTIINTVTCGATVKVNKSWVIDGAAPTSTPPEDYSATLTLDGAEKLFGKEYSGYGQGDSVKIDEVKVQVPTGCDYTPSGDIGTETLVRGPNVFTITNTVTCDASVKVDKLWVINGVEYDDKQQPTGFTATLSLDEAAGLPFGNVFEGYQQGETVSINEAYDVPDGCSNVKSGDLYEQELDKGLNTFTITNTVTCGATVKVNKVWKINGVDYTNENKPGDYSAQLTLSGNEGPDAFGTVYTGYTEGDQVTIGEDVVVPQACVNVKSGDLGPKTLVKGSNVFTVVNTVRCETPPPPPAPGSVRVEKLDAVTGALIDTAKFKLWRDSGTTVGAVDAGDILVAPGEVSTGTSGNAAGTYSWSGLSQGAYILEETVAPMGYLLSQPATQAFTLSSGTTVTKQFRNPQSPTSVEVLKQDDETGEVLEGAEFQAYADNGSTPGVLDAGDTPIGAPVLTDARGVARWTGLLFGRYLFEEVAAPEGYGLPEETVQSVTLDARNAGGTIRLVFLDPGQGTLKVTKAAFELVRGEWVESDGVVEFGDQVKYVVTLTADGPKIHHDVVVSDYIPGNDPDDTASDTEGIYVTGTAVCVEAGECTVTFDSTEQLLTWELGDVRDEARSVEFVIEFPQPADDASTAEGVYTETLANTAAASWTDRNGDQEVDSNEVVVDAELVIAPAEEEVPPAKPRPPAEILPETGAQAGLGLWTTLGGLMVALGVALLTLRRRNAS